MTGKAKVTKTAQDQWAESLPDVAVAILTYERPTELKATLQALQTHLIYPAAKLHFFVFDDASPSGVDALKADPAFKNVVFAVNGENQGWGVTVNRALHQLHGGDFFGDKYDLIYFTEDDYVLTRDLDLWRGVALLTVNEQVGMVRYRATAGEAMLYHQGEADVQALAPDPQWREAPGSYVAGRLTYLALGQGSPSAYLYSNGPHLQHKRFMDFYGDYAEVRKLGDTEEEYAIRVKAMMKADPTHAQAIAVLPEFISMQYEHIGTSYQLTPVDRTKAAPDDDVTSL